MDHLGLNQKLICHIYLQTYFKCGLFKFLFLHQQHFDEAHLGDAALMYCGKNNSFQQLHKAAHTF